MTISDPYQKCWANSLGDCTGSMSMEHIFSKAVARKESKTEMAVKGMANMPDRLIGFDWPKARILCEGHNSKLSPLDSEAKKLAECLHQFVDRIPHTTVCLSGLLLERWALKTVINFMAAGFADERKWLPDGDLVCNVFGIKPIPDGCGLYLLRVDGYAPVSTEQAGIIPVWAGSEDKAKIECMGAIVYLHGAAFFLLLQTYFLDALRMGELSVGDSELKLTYDRLTYHPKNAQLDDGQGHTMLALFDWG